MEPLRKGVAYLRRSSNRQRHNHSLDFQREQVLRCAQMNGYEVTSLFIDDAVSAYRRPAIKREAMKALFATVLEQDEVMGVFFYDESRVSRQMTDFVREVHDPIKEKKPECQFFNAVTGSWDPASPFVQAQLLMAQYESGIKSTRAIDAQKMLLRHDDKNVPRRPGAPAPYGYKWNGRVLEPHTTASVALFIFHLASWGYSDVRVANILNQAKIPAPKSREWKASTIDVILNNPVYCGDLAWNRRTGYSNSSRKQVGQFDLFKGQIEGIVPRPLWDIVHQLRILKKETGVKFDTPNLIQGLVYCKKCDVELIVKDSTPARSTKRYVHYICPACGRKIETATLDQVVLTQVSKEWSGHAGVFRREARNMLVRWNRALIEAKKEAEGELKEAEYQRAMLSSSSPYAERWDNIIKAREVEATERFQKTSSLLNEVSMLREPVNFEHWLGRFMQPDWVKVLSNSERRTFCFFVIQRVNLEFTTVPKVSIRYRLSPFTNLADVIDEVL